ncbi:MAG: polysaccharide deacetylase family protein [Solirubrobacteraceae bacterium]
MDRSRRLPVAGGLIAAAAGAAGALYGGPALARAHAIAALREHCAARGALALTYDDGPGDRLTGRVLDLLAQRGAVATFFALGARAAAGPELLDRVVAEGHELGCHSHDHLDAWRVAPWRAAADLERGYATLAPWLRADAPYRPPHGRPTLAVRAAARRRGARLAWWTLDSGDTFGSPPAPADVAARLEEAGGGVVLLHDFDRTGADAGARAEHVLETTRLALDAAERRRWTVETFSHAAG